MARQPEVAGQIQTAMIIAAALIEGVTFFAHHHLHTGNGAAFPLGLASRRSFCGRRSHVRCVTRSAHAQRHSRASSVRWRLGRIGALLGCRLHPGALSRGAVLQSDAHTAAIDEAAEQGSSPKGAVLIECQEDLALWSCVTFVDPS